MHGEGLVLLTPFNGSPAEMMRPGFDGSPDGLILEGTCVVVHNVGSALRGWEGVVHRVTDAASCIVDSGSDGHRGTWFSLSELAVLERIDGEYRDG